jgi:hypothetical protein
VRNEHHRQAKLQLQLLHQVQHLSLNGYVEGGYRFVGDDQFGLYGECAGNADALALPSGELVRIAACVFRPQADAAKQLRNALLTCCAPGEAVGVDGLADDVSDAHARVEAGIGILKDDLQTPAIGTQLLFRQLKQIDAIENRLAAGRLYEPQDAAPGRRLA